MSKRILIVDDEPTLRAALRLVLETAGYEVTEAEDGHDGLAQLDTSPPDLVLLDVRMPRLGGTEFLAALATRCEPPPAIVVTGYDHGQASYPGAADVIQKPVMAEELLTKVDRRLKAQERRVAECKREGRADAVAVLAACVLFGCLCWMGFELLAMRYTATVAPVRVIVVERERPAPVDAAPGASLNRYLASQAAEQNAEFRRRLEALEKPRAGL